VVSLAAILVQANEPFEFDELMGQLVRYGVIALFLFGPLLKKLFDRKSQPQSPQGKRPVVVRQPVALPEEVVELTNDWTVLPKVEPGVQERTLEPTWIEEPKAMPTRLAEGDLMHASVDEHVVPLDLPTVDRRGTRRGWRSAIILREVLGPPVGLRSQNADRAPFG